MTSSATAMAHTITPSEIPAGASPDTGTTVTRTLLTCGMGAGPLFVVVALIQVLTRPGFDLTHQALSLLTLGDLGWVQSANFIATGLLFLAGAAGVRRVLHAGPASRWAPILMAAVGVGLAGGGVFHPDPSGGFPPGTNSSLSAVTSWHGTLHMIFGSAAFLSLIVLCFVLARRFASTRQRRWATCSRGAGALCAVGVASGGAPGGTLSLFIGVSIALIWIAMADALILAELGTVSA